MTPASAHTACTLACGLLLSCLVAHGAPEPARPPEPVAAYHAPADPAELLQTDEPMRRFFGERMHAHHSSGNQLRALLDAIVEPNGLKFAYDAAGTFDARETFRRRQGNCVSFAFLVVAVAREFGYHASFQDVPTPERWDRFGNLIVSIRHINVRIDAGNKFFVFDLRPDLAAGVADADLPELRDERAYAQFYDTSGVYALLGGQAEEALRDITLATTIDPTFAPAWSNRASLQMHLGNLAEARAGYEQSLRADPQYLFALDGYVDVLRRLGSPEPLRLAEKYTRRAQAIRERNPYYLQQRAELAQKLGDWAGAEKLLRRAIAFKDNEPQFYEQWAAVLRQLGREDAARRAEARLAKLRPQPAAAPNAR